MARNDSGEVTLASGQIDREAMLRRFESWLDELERAEAPPEGIAAELLDALAGNTAFTNPESDLYSMQAAITALTQEVKLQSRSYKQLSDTIAPVAELGPRMDQAIMAYSDVVAELRREAENRAQAEILDALLDMRDRLARGLESSRHCMQALPEPRGHSWIERVLSREDKQRESARAAVEAIEKGVELSLDRLDEILGRFHVSEIACLGREFDAESMSAVETEETERVSEGTVVEVYRAGYEWNGKVYRTAQVKVARAPREKNVEVSHE